MASLEDIRRIGEEAEAAGRDEFEEAEIWAKDSFHAGHTADERDHRTSEGLDSDMEMGMDDDDDYN